MKRCRPVKKERVAESWICILGDAPLEVLTLNMGMVDPGSFWDGAGINGVAGDEHFLDIINILDFPMESLEGDELVADWDANKSHCLGPIPSDVLIGSPTIPCGNFNIGHPIPGLVFPIDETPQQKQQCHRSKVSSGRTQHNITNVQESGVFLTQSPVSVLESSGYCSAGNSLPMKSFNPIVRKRSKRVRRSSRNPWLSLSHLFFTNSASKRAPEKKEKKKLSQLTVPVEAIKDYSQRAEYVFQMSDNEEPQSGTLQRRAITKKCTHCEVTKTPQWREGPLGPKTLCNACGVRYRTGRLFPEYRPAASPTFVPSVHSNSHKKVVEMRNKAKWKITRMEETPSSPQPEFVPMSSYMFDLIY